MVNLSGSASIQSETVRREQYESLARTVPLMYALMFLNILFLSLVTVDDGSWEVGFVAPLALMVIIAVRGSGWYVRMNAVRTDEHIHRYLRDTVDRTGPSSQVLGGGGLNIILA